MQIRKFFTFEKAAGVIMLISMALALIAANSPLAGLYQAIHHSPIHIRVGGLIFEGTLVHWINQGLMVIFFVLVGFEIKRQMIEGHLSTAKSAALPAISALGGMLVPAIIYVGLNIGDAAAIGINDVMAPDFGEPVPIEDGEIPVFWACGVTPQMAIKQARPDICITHAPGFMVITDIAASELAAGRGPEISSAPHSNYVA